MHSLFFFFVEYAVNEETNMDPKESARSRFATGAATMRMCLMMMMMMMMMCIYLCMYVCLYVCIQDLGLFLGCQFLAACLKVGR
jgi:hypothetical protein